MIDVSKAPSGAERYTILNDKILWTRELASYIQYWNDPVKLWFTPYNQSEARDNFDFSNPIPKDSPVTPEEEEALAKVPEIGRSKYHVEIKPGVWIDVYDVLQAYSVTNSALAHLIKKALKPGERGHKDLTEDLEDIVASAKRALELEESNG